ncbi:hypothetical protein [Specibacter cremeus]|uniref:hypothetical protein n=1 Tax=Specibacter cremeus TaxID=1629051 RepID=UPI000F76A199|nr:hypothetical protein [Specibacter cremeus]
MKNGSVIGTANAVAAVPFERIRPLINVDGARVLLGLDYQPPGLTVGAEPARSLVWMHGAYWYQGEYIFKSHPQGTAVTYRIRNISGHPDLVIRVWQRRVLKAQQQNLDVYLLDLPNRL